ncbi:unnamed protein product [Cercopithifilaria johnstoni]|uniref:EGF-like domain-containing protein n=1 Tax=Cercopithifilaria johnstoni TaxID=2874296 RepID=A0A8J2Q3B7_9BILA|nr:unnamed protein product [Cercopithifilaria johnstoni]
MRINPGVACDITRDIGMIESPDGNSNFYMRCISIGFRTMGMWKLESCLPGYTFQISEKRCVPNQFASHTNNKIFAILNNSCANGKECIGGTVCDPSSTRCLCPPDMIPNLNTLSCIPISFSSKSFHQKDYNTYSPSGREMMITTGNNILPDIFRVRVPPGSSCSNNEMCGGGSFCSLPMKFCLCPDDMQDFGGQCRKPEQAIIPAAVGLGDSCSDAVLHCLNGTTCIDGQCKCPIFLIQEGNQCVEKQSRFRVGPGEMCNGSHVCSRGSICHPTIPVCICPENTVLQENSCLPFASVMQRFIAVSELNTGFGGVGQVAVGFPCRANIDCIKGAFCKINNNSGICQCLSTYVRINDFCEKAIYPGQSGCHYDIQCSIIYVAARCSAGQCICPDGFSAVGQTCKPDKQTIQIPPGGSCMIDRDCAGGSRCQDDWCICPEVSMKVINGECKKVYGGSLLTEIQNNTPAINTLMSNIEMTIPSITSSPLGIVPALAKISPETIETLVVPATFKLPIIPFTSTTVPLQYVGDILLIDSLNHWQAFASTISTIKNSTLLSTSISVRFSGQPRITGPPLRKSRLQTTTISIYKSRPGNGICPTPNSVVLDESTNYLIVCNGEKPLCPPNSYCYITGYANQEYNCCWS